MRSIDRLKHRFGLPLATARNDKPKTSRRSAPKIHLNQPSFQDGPQPIPPRENLGNYNQTQLEIIADGCVARLKENRLSDYLMYEFDDSQFLPKWLEYRAPIKGFSDGSIYDLFSPLLNGMLEYLSIPYNVELRIISDPDFSYAGSYSRNGFERIITLNYKDDYTPRMIVAILCHECTHCFMEENSLNWFDTELNEVRTDVMAALIGFGKLMIDGYKSISIQTREGSITTGMHSVGYITQNDCEVLREYLQNERKVIKLHKKILNELSTYNDIFERYTSCLDILIGKDDTHINREDFSSLQYWLLSIESDKKISDNMMSKIEKAETVEDYFTLSAEIYSSCTDFTNRLSKLSKYL